MRMRRLDILRATIKMLIVNGKRSISRQFRLNRFKLLNSIVSSIIEKDGRCTILDVGGTEDYWDINGGFIDSHRDRLKIYIINIDEFSGQKTHRSIFEYVTGDATKAHIYNSVAYDFIHSNSVIEHVGHWPDIRSMANCIEQSAKPFFLQTPNFWFPMEPHFRTLFYHWSPETVRAEMLVKEARGFRAKCDNWHEAMAQVESVKLLTYSQLKILLPDARIVREHFLGLTKSFMVVRDPTSS